MQLALAFSTRRPNRHSRHPVEPLSPVPDRRTSAAMDDTREAERLMADLLALVDAGLVAPQRSDDELRYAVAKEELS